MMPAARTVYAYGVYLIVLGLIFLFRPCTISTLLKISPDPALARIVGLLILSQAFYFVMCARHEVILFIRWTVWGHIFLSSAILALVVCEVLPEAVSLFAFISMLGSMVTALALRGRTYSKRIHGI